MLKNKVSGYPVKFGLGSCNINYYTLQDRGGEICSQANAGISSAKVHFTDFHTALEEPLVELCFRSVIKKSHFLS